MHRHAPSLVMAVQADKQTTARPALATRRPASQLPSSHPPNNLLMCFMLMRARALVRARSVEFGSWACEEVSCEEVAGKLATGLACRC